MSGNLQTEGIVLVTRESLFWCWFVPVFLISSFILNFLASGSATLAIFNASGFSGKMEILGSTFLSIFGVGRNFVDFIYIFLLALLQATLIGLIAVVWQHNQRQNRRRKKVKDSSVESATAGLQNSGIVAGLAILGSGCPTCGTTLLAPLLGAIASGGGFALANAISGIITTIAVVIAVFSLKKVGFEVFVILTSRKRHQKRKELDEQSN